jgi:Family of unknown function (DUF6518)
MRTALAGIGAGIAVGVLNSFGPTEVHGAAAAFFNSASAWLIAPFVVGAAVARTRAGAAAAGMATCVLQLVVYDVTASMRGFAVGVAINAFWAVCAVVGGPLFGLAGCLWREGSAIGAAALPAAFLAEGLWVYGHRLHYSGAAALWLAIGAALAVLLGRGRGLVWLAPAVLLGVACEIVLSQVYAQTFFALRW